MTVSARNEKFKRKINGEDPLFQVESTEQKARWTRCACLPGGVGGVVEKTECIWDEPPVGKSQPQPFGIWGGLRTKPGVEGGHSIKNKNWGGKR